MTKGNTKHRQSDMRHLRGEVRFDEPMKRHTTFRIGGPADIYYRPADVEDLVEALAWCATRSLSYLVIGAGSNLLVADGGIRRMVIVLNECINSIEWKGSKVIVGAGVSLTRLAWKAGDKGFVGLAFAAGIPGNLGGALVMNAGAYDCSMADVVEGAEILDDEGTARYIEREQMGLGYRSSKLPWGVITRLHLALDEGDPEALKQEMKENERKRRDTQPLSYPSAGCIFRNLKEQRLSAGKLIEEVGLKGKRIGGAQISSVHANFIVNVEDAQASDVMALIECAEETVERELGITLVREVRVVGKWGDRLPSRKSERV